MNIKSLASAFFLLTATTGLQAIELENGHVYRIRNANNNTLSMSGAASGQNLVTTTTTDTDLKQQWYVTTPDDGATYYFRNVGNGGYMKSSLATSANWTVEFVSTPVDASMRFTLTERGENINIRAQSDKSSYGYAHNAAGNSVVCWEPANMNSQWKFELIEKTDAEIRDMLDRFAGTADEISRADEYQQHLQALFTDYACTDLRAIDDLDANADYKALSPALRAMVAKIHSKDWSETAGDWNSDYAKKYRVQLYEPYSEGSAAASMAGIQAYTNMNNPTGIVANANELLYVMVDTDIPEGATLYMAGCPDGGMYNSTTSGTKLKKGLNIVLCSQDMSHYFIYYTVNTVQNKKPTQYKVTDFPSIKIHIEGGQVNGFFNYIGDSLYSADTDEDYRYTVARAIHPMYDLLGKYVILHFFLNDTPDLPTDTQLHYGVRSSFDPQINKNGIIFDPAVTMKNWDDMCFPERILMGIQSDADINLKFNRGYYSSIVNDGYEKAGYIGYPEFQYSDYFNNRMMGITLQAKGLYMNATAWRTAYAPSTMSAILSQFGPGGIWGPAHEYGHMNQTPMRIAGTTEESNNVFSNVALFYSEYATTSRCNYPSEQLKIFNQDRTFLDHGTWGTTRMFWQLWCYYHATGHNTKFYPRLYELLRRYPLKRDMTTYPGYLNPRYDMLHFAKMCCIAAGEDLTNFFTAWGFFVPLDGYHISDYDEYDCKLTPEDIQAVKDEIAAFGFEPNDAIILIDDRPGSDLPSHSEFKKDKAGELGGLDDFRDGTTPSGSFGFTIDGNTVVVDSSNGTDGVGFLVYDNDGNLIGFSNSHEFELSDEAIALLLSGNATVVAVGADNSTVEVTNTVLDGGIEEKLDMLNDLIERCNRLLAFSDPSESKVGYLYPDSCINLIDLRDKAVALVDPDAATPSGTELTEMFLSLYDAYNMLLNNDEAQIAIEPGAAYRFVNMNYPAWALAAKGAEASSGNVKTDEQGVPFDQQWIMESASTTNGKLYYLRNMDTDSYLGAKKANYVVLPMVAQPQSYTLVNISQGVYAIAAEGNNSWGVHMDSSHKIVHWSATSTASNWTLIKSSPAEYVATRKALLEMIDQADELLHTAGTVTGLVAEPVAFTEENFSTNAEYTGPNSGDRLSSWKVLFDNNIGTYFHSDYSGNNSTDGLDHYIQMSAPEGSTFRNFTLSYTTRNNTSNTTNPRAFTIQGSTDGATWNVITSVSEGLPLGAAVSYTTPELVAPQGTTHLRFIINKTGDTRGGHAYFALSELSVKNRDDRSMIPSAEYPSVTEQHMDNVADDMLGATDVASSPASSQQDLQDALDALTDSHNALYDAMNDRSSALDNVVGGNDSHGPVDVYDLNGRLVMHGADSHNIQQLPHGIYIVRQGASARKVFVD